MGKFFNAAVRKQFAAAIAVAAPQFAPAKASSRHAWPGECAFSWTPQAGIKCWLSLVTNHKGNNEFFLECGWSIQDRYPELTSRPSLAGMEAADNVERFPEFMCRLSSLGSTPGAWRYRPKEIDDLPEAERLLPEVHALMAPLSPEQAEEIARPLVADAVEAFKKLGVPFLTRCANKLAALRTDGNSENAT
jgi:hypothetical protein